MSEFCGKYRGAVANDVDPLEQGRVQVSVPAVFGAGRLRWAMPCAPFAGPQVGLFTEPPVGANVCVELDAGLCLCAEQNPRGSPSVVMTQLRVMGA